MPPRDDRESEGQQRREVRPAAPGIMCTAKMVFVYHNDSKNVKLDAIATHTQ
jgi:hypothetical protein